MWMLCGTFKEALDNFRALRFLRIRSVGHLKASSLIPRECTTDDRRHRRGGKFNREREGKKGKNTKGCKESESGADRGGERARMREG